MGRRLDISKSTEKLAGFVLAKKSENRAEKYCTVLRLILESLSEKKGAPRLDELKKIRLRTARHWIAVHTRALQTATDPYWIKRIGEKLEFWRESERKALS